VKAGERARVTSFAGNASVGRQPRDASVDTGHDFSFVARGVHRLLQLMVFLCEVAPTTSQPPELFRSAGYRRGAAVRKLIVGLSIVSFALGWASVATAAEPSRVAFPVHLEFEDDGLSEACGFQVLITAPPARW
jgi:hypothetical protein